MEQGWIKSGHVWGDAMHGTISLVRNDHYGHYRPSKWTRSGSGGSELVEQSGSRVEQS